jgi:hypothetical protein
MCLNADTGLPWKIKEDARMDVFDAIRDAKATHIRKFSNGSGIIYYDNGYVSFFWLPRNTLEPVPVPEAILYYWQIMRGRPDVKTWDDIMRAKNESR